jgi:hypothetical protein
VSFAGFEGDGVIAGVGGLDADEVRVGLIGEIGEAGGFFDPGIPDDGAEAAGFFDAQLAAEDGIIDDHGGVGGVKAVHLLVDDDGTFLRALVR